MSTIYDIAKRVGCAPSTVSRALGGISGVKEETRQTILKIAEEMSYVPDSTAKNLKTKRSWNIGVITYINEMMGLRHYLFADILNNFANVVEEANYDITLFSKKLVSSQNSLLSHCRSKKLDGLFIVCGDFTTNPILELINSEIPVVTVDYFGAKDNNVHCVTSDNYKKMLDLTNYILDKGHKNIVYITGKDIYVSQERVKGFKEALKLKNIDFREDMLISADFYNFDLAQKCARQVLERKTRPTAIIMPDDYCAIAAYDVARELGLSIPDDISIAGFDGLEIGQKLYPPMTTIKQNTIAMGEYAAKRLLKLINKEAIIEEPLHMVEAKLLKGNSIKEIK